MNAPDVRLTIAFISVNEKHPTTQNFKLFGQTCWSDACTNESRKDDYFVFYIQKKSVRVHKVTDVSPYSQRPEVMKNWTGTSQIVYLSKEFNEYAWDVWNSSIGKGAPYTNAPGEKGYGSNRTTTWSASELKTKFPNFEVDKFITQSSMKHPIGAACVQTQTETSLPLPVITMVDSAILYKKKKEELIDLETKQKEELIDLEAKQKFEKTLLEAMHQKEKLELESKY